MDASFETRIDAADRSWLGEPVHEVTSPSRDRPQATRAREPVVRRWPLWLLRVTVTAQALDAVLQAAFAGRFLSGDFGMLLVHRPTARRCCSGCPWCSSSAA